MIEIRKSLRSVARIGLVLPLLVGGLTVTSLVASPMASADTGVALPPPKTATTPPVLDHTINTVTNDALPTVQIGNGVVWSTVTSGNTVFAGGQFSTARPSGAAAGVNEVTRNNFLAFDIRTGVMNTSIAPSFNGTVKDVTASPDGSTIYVAGTFTQVNGQARQGVAAINASTGALTAFNAKINGGAAAVTATNNTVYVGGTFSAANNVARGGLAAFAAGNGNLLAWAPTPDMPISAAIMSPDESRVIVGGRFSTINGSPAYGIGSLDASTGALLPFAINNVVRNGGGAATISLAKDSSVVYGTSGNYGTGNFEGTWAADPNTGNIVWLDDCHGDTYDTFSPDNGVVYNVGHAHYCENIGGFPDTNPRIPHPAMAFTQAANGQVQQNGQSGNGYGNFAGQPAPSIINWFPSMDVGTFTGIIQAAWSLTGNSTYVVAGGEFPKVNGVKQQGLTRFAIASTAPKKSGPVKSGTQIAIPTATMVGPAVRVGWQTNWDKDGINLTYKVYRTDKGTTTPIATLNAQSTFWYLPSLSFKDTTIQAGKTYTYKLTATDADGNTANYQNVSVTTPADLSISAYAQHISDSNALDYWRMSEFSNGGTSADWLGGSSLTAGIGVSSTTPGAIGNDTDGTGVFNGTSNGTSSTSTAITGPNTFSVEAWIKTTTNQGGKIIGFGNATTGNSGSYDRHVYMDNAGKIWFGAYPNAVRTVNGSKSYNDGQWHHIVAAMGADGMKLYVDDALVGARSDTTSAQGYTGYWRVGGDNLSGWPNQPSSPYFNGSIDDVAIYPSVLTGAQIDADWVASGRTSTLPAAPADAYGAAVFNAGPDFYWRLGESSGTTAADVMGGVNGNYSGGVTKGVAGAIVGVSNTAAQFDGIDGLVASSTSFDNPTTFSESLWFSTTTNSGGKLIGFGDQPTGTSSNYDRHVYMDPSGHVNFGVWTGQANVITSPQTYNDGQWHQMVATQDGTGMKLFIDGAQVGTDPQTSQQPYTGYWRVGGDTSWNGAPFFNGKIDEVAVYSRALTGTEVGQQYAIGAKVNALPTAAFSSQVTDLSVAFDGSDSADSDGTIASYSWDFGDNSPAGSGVNPTHVYGSAATYQVTLTVTDNDGGTKTITHPVTSIAPNVLPTAAFTAQATDLSVAFDGSDSVDSDGAIASYSWDFGDNTPAGSGVNPTHVYGASDTYQVKLTVTDNRGGTKSITKPVIVTAPNVLPTAAFTSVATGLSVAFDGSDSADSDGTISSFSWDFGDNTPAGTGVNPTHAFGSADTYQVTLTVTDNRNGTKSVTHPVTVSKLNVPPTAAFTSVATGLSVAFDGSDSADSDGTIASYSWDFGDNTPAGTGVNPTHVYGSSDTYQVTLTVTDNKGATKSITKPVTVTAANVPPTAAFTSQVSGLSVAFNGSGSTDADGTIASYSWDFGDNTPAGSGETPSHLYGSADTYQVTLTVTDDKGATKSITKPVTTVAGPVLLANDTFTRTATSSWGTPEAGGVWTITGGAARFSVDGSVGLMKQTAAGQVPTATQNGVAFTDGTVQFDLGLSVPSSGSGYQMTTMVRRVGSTDYRLKIKFNANSTATLTISRLNGTEVGLSSATVSGLTTSPNTMYRVKFNLATNGATTTLRAKMYEASATEPAAWKITTSDSTAALQASGVVSLQGSSNAATNLPAAFMIDNWSVNGS